MKYVLIGVINDTPVVIEFETEDAARGAIDAMVKGKLIGIFRSEKFVIVPKG